MIRFCPSCETERPLTEVFCEGTVNGLTCHWDLSAVDVGEPGAVPPQAPPVQTGARCPNGHAVGDGDLICPVCEAPVGFAEPPVICDPEPPVEETVIEGWRLRTRLPASSAVRERFIAVNEVDGRRAVLTLYTMGSEPDPAVYEVLRNLPRDHVPEIIATGRWGDRAFEVSEELAGGNLADILLSPDDLATIRQVVEQLGRALNAFAEAGLRHRDLRPGVVLVRSREPLDLAIGGFGSGRLSDFDLDIVSPLETTRYMAPEAIAGGVAAASDWWSVGMLLLERITRGACFEGINEQVFLIHVLTNGVPIPDGIDPSLDNLFRGLLARDRRERWQWNEVRAWLAGEVVKAPAGSASAEDLPTGAAITLSGKSFRTATAFALAAAEAANWDEARERLVRGVVATWAEDAGFDSKLRAGLRQLGHAHELTDDLRLSIALKILHPAMPMVIRGNILTPGWLLDHPDDGYALITGPAPEFLKKIDAEDWLSRLKARAETVRARVQQLEIAVNEDELRINLLSTSMARLAALWEERRKFLPDTDHPGLASLIERRQTTEEDLILLLSASIGQFRSVAEIVEEAAKEGARAGFSGFATVEAEVQLKLPRREIYRAVDERTAHFARCAIPLIDDWADQFRLDRRMPLARALVLLSVPETAWKELPKQSYISTILDFFSKKISGGVLRGPLARMLISKSSARVDIAELGSPRLPASEILEQLLARSSRDVNVDPAVFAESDTLERRLRSLHSHALLYRRDTGIDGLYLGFPFLLLQDPRANTKPRIAPVLLWPVRINPEVGNRGHVTLGFGRDHGGDRDPEQIILNPAFEGLMGFEAARRWQEAADDLLSRASISAADAMDAFGTLAASRGDTLSLLPGKDVEVGAYRPELAPAAVLFHLTFMGQAIVKDLDHLKERPPAGTGLETALRLGDQKIAEQKRSNPPEVERYFTADSDPSQEAAVMDSRFAPGLVIEGPPGTGKSQTIVNMVADAIGREKSLLVICQKQAALDVVRKRLEKEQLRDRFVMITDINRDREPIVRSIREQVEALHARPSGGAPSWKRDRAQLAARIESLEGELDRHQEALHRADAATGLTYRTLLGELLSLEAGEPTPIELPALRPYLAGLNLAEVATLEESCAPIAKYWLPAKFEGSSLSVLKIFSAERGTLDVFIKALKDFVKVEDLREEVSAANPDFIPIRNPALLRAWLGQHANSFRSLSESLCKKLGLWLPLFRPVGANRGAAMLADLSRTISCLAELDASAHPAPASVAIRELSDQEMPQTYALAVDATKTAVGLRRLSLARWLQRRKLRRRLVSMDLASDEAGMNSFLVAAGLELALRPLRVTVYAMLKTLFNKSADVGLPPAELAGIATNMRVILSAVQDLVTAIDDCPCSTELEVAALTGNVEEIQIVLRRLESSLNRFDASEASLEALQGLIEYFDETWITLRRSAIEAGLSNTDAISVIVECLPILPHFQEFRIRGARLSSSELSIFRMLRNRESELEQLSPNDLDQCIRRTIGHEARLAWKVRLETLSPEVLLDSDTLNAKVRALADADAGIRRCNRELLVHGIDPRRVASVREWEAITRLRGQRSLRLREFIDKAAVLGLMALRPVWLMTPDVASRVLLPKAGMFDTVIYDEASQMPVEYALPTLFRGKVVVVSGDEKQMPPTAFFSSRVENDEAALFDGEEPEDTASEEERDAFDETWNRREIKDCPDLLHLARVVLPTRTLQVHYRSAYRELIAFSNASFYGNRLSVPVRHPDHVVRRIRPIQVVRSEGLYKNQTNIKEGADVVEYLTDLWTKSASPSVGVVTFNRKQADLINDALEERAEENRAFRDALMRERERMEGGEDMGFFVKNVENVQGDERDIIVFSSTFGPNEQQRFRKNFGVLGQAGGERRLNVAVTRARQKIVLMTSMPIGDISDFLTTRRPPGIPRDYLQAYMEYARTVSEGSHEVGRTLLERLVTDRSSVRDRKSSERDGFSDAVGEFLRAQGWEPAHADDGGAFGLDFAIESPVTGLYAVGIECDAPRHRILERARAREVWRPRVLRHAVPHVHRVSSYGWVHARDEEQSRLKKAVQHALESGGASS